MNRSAISLVQYLKRIQNLCSLQSPRGVRAWHILKGSQIWVPSSTEEGNQGVQSRNYKNYKKRNCMNSLTRSSCSSVVPEVLKQDTTFISAAWYEMPIHQLIHLNNISKTSVLFMPTGLECIPKWVLVLILSIKVWIQKAEWDYLEITWLH